MAHGGVPAAAAVDLLTPCDWMVATHLSAGISRLVERRQHMRRTARIAAKVVPFVGPPPDYRQILCRKMTAVRDMDGRRLDLRVAREIGTDKPSVPRPLILGVAGRVNAGEPAAGADEALKGGLLGRVEDVSCRGKEDDDAVPGELC